jgi:tetratricopeptide (TPR) repeat protein
MTENTGQGRVIWKDSSNEPHIATTEPRVQWRERAARSDLAWRDISGRPLHRYRLLGRIAAVTFLSLVIAASVVEYRGWHQREQLRRKQEIANHQHKLAEVAWAQGSQALEQGNSNKALAAFDRAIAFEAGFAVAYVSRGNAQLALGKYDAALASYSEAMVRDSDLTDAYLARGAVHWLVGDLASAELDFATLTTKRPGDSSSAAKYVRVLYDEGKKREVQDFYQSLNARFPGREWVVAGLLYAVQANAGDERHGHEARVARAHELWNRGIRANAVMLALGDSLLELGDYREAIMWLKPLMGADPNDIPPDAVKKLALAYSLSHEPTLCADTWKNYLSRMGRIYLYDQTQVSHECGADGGASAASASASSSR